MHKIQSITHKDGTPRTDGRYPLRVGCTVKILGCTKESPMAFGYIQDNAGNPKSGVLLTSTVQGISIDGSNLVVSPLLGGIAPLIGGDAGSALDVDIDKAAPAIGGAFQSLSGDKLESLLRKLLTQFQNITVETGDPGGAVWLTEDLVNTLFSGNVQDLFVLAFQVIKVNYSGFFARLGGPSGKVVETMMTLVSSSGTAD